MPYLRSSQEWLQQSSLLLKAYPSSTRITTKYSVVPPDDDTKSKKRKRPAKDAESSAQDADTSIQAPTVRAELILKTYDPSSGVCLKYRTDKAAEVGRLISSLGRLGRSMAALPDQVEDITMTDITAAENAPRTSTPVPETQQVKNVAADAKGGQTGGGGKKKKKGKK